MHIELQQAMQNLVAEQSLNLKEISRFTPVDFRLGIQYLVAQDQPDLAQALAEAGLALYPLSEDILAISGLLAITREDWSLAVEILQDLVSVQDNRVQPHLSCKPVRVPAFGTSWAEHGHSEQRPGLARSLRQETSHHG